MNDSCGVLIRNSAIPDGVDGRIDPVETLRHAVRHNITRYLVEEFDIEFLNANDLLWDLIIEFEGYDSR